MGRADIVSYFFSVLLELVSSSCIFAFGLSQIPAVSEYYAAAEKFLPRGTFCTSRTRAQTLEHGSYLCESACVPCDTSCQKRKVVNVLNGEVLTHVRNGGTPAKPAYCPDPLYKIMQLCWAYEREQRPTFADILSMFEKLRDKIEFQGTYAFNTSTMLK
ncbi:hypothetical protein Y032_0075g932 [Ancylostoma ceylanicum]|nr:hypothetical protein Y032_0075g932 [Ancylostoma ceylanicum]